MKKIYYLQKHEVKLGDVIEHNGFRATITEKLIELNPKLFKIENGTEPMYFRCLENGIDFTKNRIYIQNNHSTYPTRLILRADDNILYSVPDWNKSSLYKSYNLFELTTKAEWNKQELLDKAKRDYPVGTMFESWYQKDKYNMIPKNSTFKWESNIIIVATDEFPLGMATLYKDSRWVEILPLKFTTEDGVDIYGDMKTYLVYPNDSVDICFRHCPWKGNTKIKGSKYFYYKENALAYIEKHKEKTLEDYENLLVNYGGVIVYRNGATHSSVWDWFKTYEPKLYYTKILQLIADDLNDGRYIHERGNTSYHLSDARGVNIHCGYDEGCVYFKSEDLVEKARVILGDKEKHINNQLTKYDKDTSRCNLVRD